MARSDEDKLRMRIELAKSAGIYDGADVITQAIIELCITIDEAVENIASWLEVIHRDMPS